MCSVCRDTLTGPVAVCNHKLAHYQHFSLQFSVVVQTWPTNGFINCSYHTWAVLTCPDHFRFHYCENEKLIWNVLAAPRRSSTEKLRGGWSAEIHSATFQRFSLHLYCVTSCRPCCCLWRQTSLTPYLDLSFFLSLFVFKVDFVFRLLWNRDFPSLDMNTSHLSLNPNHCFSFLLSSFNFTFIQRFKSL